MKKLNSVEPQGLDIKSVILLFKIETPGYVKKYTDIGNRNIKIVSLSIVPNSFWAMSDLKNPSNKSDFYI